MLYVLACCSGRVEQVPWSAPCFWRGLLFLCTCGSAVLAVLLICVVELRNIGKYPNCIDNRVAALLYRVAA